MDGFRSPQDTVALHDIAYVIRFGHFPIEDEEEVEGVKGEARTTASPPPTTSTPLGSDPEEGCDHKEHHTGPKQQSGAPRRERRVPDEDADTSRVGGNLFENDGNPFSDDGNPFSDDGNPFSDDGNPFGDDGNPLYDDSTNPFAEDLNPFHEDHNSTMEEGEPSFTSTTDSFREPQEAPSGSQHTPHSPCSCPMSSIHQADTRGVSRKLAKEVVTELFNVTHLDLRRLLQKVGDSKETPKVQLLLEELRAEGLGLQPTTGSCSPPLVFLRAAVGELASFTTFTSTSTTRAMQDTITMNVKNMYTENLLLQVWKASVPSLAVESLSSGPMMDVLSRLIKHAKEKTGPASPARHRVNGEDATTAASDVGQEVPTEAATGHRDEVDHADDVPIINVSIWENRKGQRSDGTPPKESSITGPTSSMANGESVEDEGKSQRKGSADSQVSSGGGEGNLHVPNGEAGNDPEAASGDITVTPEVCVNQKMTSTPRGRSASFQSIELSPFSEEATKSGKSKKRKGSLKNAATSLRASFRSNFRKNKQNGSADFSNLSKPFDTSSMVSETSDISSLNPCDEEETEKDKSVDGSHNSSSPDRDDHGKGSDKNKLNRETSRSTLSITSFTRMNLSMRLKSQKATEVLRRIGSKKSKVSRSETSTPELSRRTLQPLQPADNTSLRNFDGELDNDQTDTSPIPRSTPDCDTPAAPDASEDLLDYTPHTKKSIRTMFSKPRALRTFRNLRERDASKDPSEKTESESVGQPIEAEGVQVSRAAPQNPEEVQSYLSSIGKSHLKAELLAHVSIPIKGLVGTWKKEGWLPLTIVKKEQNISLKKKKGARAEEEQQHSNNARCRFHLRLTLPSPETELTTTGYDTYNTTLRKLVHARLHTMSSLTGYRGEVGTLGDVLLQQLVFFTGVKEPQRNLAKWLVLVEVKPGDPALLLPLLRAITTHLEARRYLNAQKLQVSAALVIWVRKVLSDEFEMLHSSFPKTEGLLELARLENFLRCFNTVENCYELRVQFEREVAPLGLSAITDLLQEALIKHADTWVEALNKEKLQEKGASEADSEAGDPGISQAWAAWQESQRRASLLTKPILDFLSVSLHNYQPIFMTELSVDYMYLVMPRMLKAATHLLNPLLRFDVDGAAHQILPKTLAASSQAAWLLCTNMSNINKTGIDSRLPQHLIMQGYYDAFSKVLQQWLALSKHLALQEFQKDIQEDQFVAIDDMEGYSQSAVGVADLMKAVMKRLCGVRWPGGADPGGSALIAAGQQMMELAAQYAEQVTHAYVTTTSHTNNIPTEVCVVVRNVEHVCDEVRKHLLHLAQLAGEEQREVAQQLADRTTHLQEHVETTAEALLRQCLPGLEKTLAQGVRSGNAEFLVKTMETAMQPVRDRLYFAEPLLHQLWYRLIDHTEYLKGFYVQVENRDELRRLKVVLENAHNFLTDQDGVGLNLLDEVTKKYESVQADLRLLGATSAELVSQFYQKRFSDQQREDATSSRVVVFNAVFTETGLRVHVVQSPGMATGASLVKVRLEPLQWFPTAEPRKTHPVKSNPAVFDEVLEFPGVLDDHEEGGGMVILQVRSPRLLSSSIVHDEVILPLSELPKVPEDDVFKIPHLRLPLTRPWDFASYKPLEALMIRTQDKNAMDFLRALNERWKPSETTELIHDNLKLRASFPRAGSVRNMKAVTKKTSLKATFFS